MHEDDDATDWPWRQDEPDLSGASAERALDPTGGMGGSGSEARAERRAEREQRDERPQAQELVSTAAATSVQAATQPMITGSLSSTCSGSSPRLRA